ncbi:MAG: hypothetical protein LWX83_18770 [Anaerolineae bacterium]|nr:hypothetical protein [Anaerolineae bacterium]
MQEGDRNANDVFINCPFDEEYKALLRPMLFTLCYLNFTPRIASEYLNSADNRIEKICKLINSSPFSIHDLSKCISSKIDEFYRMNMPFELGINYGYFYFNGKEKKMLILEGTRYSFQKALSDLSGVDVKCHNNEPEDIVGCIRNWVIEVNELSVVDSSTKIWYRFTDFASDFYDNRLANGFTDKDLNDMPVPEYIKAIKDWLIKNKN